MNPHLIYQLAIGQIDELHRHAAKQRLARQTARARHRPRLPRPVAARLGFTPRPRERAA